MPRESEIRPNYLKQRARMIKMANALEGAKKKVPPETKVEVKCNAKGVIIFNKQ